MSHKLEKRQRLNRASPAGQISEKESEEESGEHWGEGDAAGSSAEVKPVKKPKKAGEMAYRFDSSFGVEIGGG